MLPFTYSSLEKVLEKQTKAISGEGRKQIEAIINQGKRKVRLINNGRKTFSHK